METPKGLFESIAHNQVGRVASTTVALGLLGASMGSDVLNRLSKGGQNNPADASLSDKLMTGVQAIAKGLTCWNVAGLGMDIGNSIGNTIGLSGLPKKALGVFAGSVAAVGVRAMWTKTEKFFSQCVSHKSAKQV
jgi:hypothetical protein